MRSIFKKKQGVFLNNMRLNIIFNLIITLRVRFFNLRVKNTVSVWLLCNITKRFFIKALVVVTLHKYCNNMQYLKYMTTLPVNRHSKSRYPEPDMPVIMLRSNTNKPLLQSHVMRVMWVSHQRSVHTHTHNPPPPPPAHTHTHTHTHKHTSILVDLYDND